MSYGAWVSFKAGSPTPKARTRVFLKGSIALSNIYDCPLVPRDQHVTMSTEQADCMHVVGKDDFMGDSDDDNSNNGGDDIDMPGDEFPAGTTITWPPMQHDSVLRDRLWEFLPVDGGRKRVLVDGALRIVCRLVVYSIWNWLKK